MRTDVSFQTITGFLTRSGTQVMQVDADFQNPVPAFTLENPASPQFIWPLGPLPTRPLLYRDGTKLFGYRVGSATAPTLLLQLAATETIAATGVEGSAFIAISANGSTRIVRIDPDFSVTTLTTFTSAPSWMSIMFTPTRLVLMIGNSVYTLPRIGGALLAIADGDTVWTLGLAAVSSEAIYVIAAAPSILGSQMRIMNSDGSNPITLNDTFYHRSFARNPWPLTGVGLPGQWSAEFDAIGIVENVMDAANVGGGTFRSYDGATRTLRTTYGILPTPPAGQRLSVVSTNNYRQVGHPELLTVLRSHGWGLSPIDLYLYNSGSPGLTRLTNHIGLE